MLERINHITPKGEQPIPPWCFWRVFSKLWKHRHLIYDYAKRETLHKYKGSYLGFLWTLLTPLLFLLLYSFTFSILFGSSWLPPRVVALKESAPQIGEGFGGFAMILFPGLLAFNLISETLNTSVGSFTDNPQYVRKMVFPLEVLPLGRTLAAFVNFIFGLVILLLGLIFIWGGIPATFPIVILTTIPILILCAGLAFFVASLSVFIRDVAHIIAVLTMALFFVSPVFYSNSRFEIIILDYFPNASFWLRNIYRINPLTTLLDNTRLVTVYGVMPEWGWLGVTTLFSLIVFFVGFYFFQKSKKAFADVI